jgi:hypothetical protein
MDGSRGRFIRSAMACLAAIIVCPEAMAQGMAVSGYPTTTSPSMGMGMNMGMNMGMGFMPIPYGLFGSASPSPIDAAALGMTRPAPIGIGMGGMTNNIFANPMAAPMMYGSTYGMTPRQAGLMMLAGQSQSMGIGSGQLSGVRPGPGGSTKGRTAQQTSSKTRGSASQPGGLAARYFHRTAPVTRYPQSYYSRQNRYYPPITR